MSGVRPCPRYTKDCIPKQVSIQKVLTSCCYPNKLHVKPCESGKTIHGTTKKNRLTSCSGSLSSLSPNIHFCKRFPSKTKAKTLSYCSHCLSGVKHFCPFLLNISLVKSSETRKFHPTCGGLQFVQRKSLPRYAKILQAHQM